MHKLLNLTRDKDYLKLKRYENDLRAFEKRYGMDSQVFYQKFESGELGDKMDFFEWFGLYEMHRKLSDKIKRLESVL